MSVTPTPQTVVREIGAFDAKNRLGTLLDWVEAGEEVVITRRGKPVARLVSAREGGTQADAVRAVERMRERAAAQAGKYDWAEWKALRDAGRA